MGEVEWRIPQGVGRGRAGGGEEQRPTQAEGKYRVLQEELLKVDIEG